MSMVRGERNFFLDVLRGVAILFVVLGHAIQSANSMNPGLPMQRVIMTFWMPLFFIISGYANGMSGGGGAVRKINRLLIPYVIWASVVYVINVCAFAFSFSVTGYFNEILRSHFWFLRVLFLVWATVCAGQLVYQRVFLAQFTWRQRVVALFWFLILVIVSLSIQGLEIAKYVMLYLFGMGISIYIGYIKHTCRIGLIFTCSVLFLVEAFMLLQIDNQLLQRLLDLSMAFTGSGFACALAYMLVRRMDFALSRFVSYCGRTSLEIYVVHWCLLFNTNLLCFGTVVKRGCNVYLVAFIGAVVWMVISILLIKIIRALPGGSIVFSGFAKRNIYSVAGRKG